MEANRTSIAFDWLPLGYWIDKSKWIKYWPDVNLANQMENTQNGRKMCKMQTKLKNVNKHDKKWHFKMVGVILGPWKD